MLANMSQCIHRLPVPYSVLPSAYNLLNKCTVLTELSANTCENRDIFSTSYSNSMSERQDVFAYILHTLPNSLNRFQVFLPHVLQGTQ